MVVFTCNSCGDSLQKPKVAKHYQFHCRNAIFLTCVDCHKDFRGDEYTAHTKCMTENERYGGKDYVTKPSANKGERKQQAWLTIVQNVLSNSNNLTVPERNLLNSISKHENIPRKKTKFYNFIRSLSGNRVNMSIVESVWDKMESAFKKATEEKAQQNGKADTNINNKSTDQETENVEKTNQSSKTSENSVEKKSKKRQLQESHADDEPSNKRKAENGNEDSPQEGIAAENGDSKFSWKNTILEVVTTKGEISMKKLKKKVIAQYLANFPDVASEKAAAKFEKKLGKVSDILISDDKVRLASS